MAFWSRTMCAEESAGDKSPRDRTQGSVRTHWSLEKEVRPEEKRPWRETRIQQKKNVMSQEPQKRKHFQEKTINPCQTLRTLFVTREEE